MSTRFQLLSLSESHNFIQLVIAHRAQFCFKYFIWKCQMSLSTWNSHSLYATCFFIFHRECVEFNCSCPFFFNFSSFSSSIWSSHPPGRALALPLSVEQIKTHFTKNGIFCSSSFSGCQLLCVTLIFFFAFYREKIHQKSTDLVIGAYDLLYKAILDPNNGYSDHSAIVPRTTEQVKTLLS